jgi:DNA-binding transcriptional LysR family regulator
MELVWLEDLIELDATRNFSVAATARNITQPAFSRRIKALENWVGTQLIDRSTYPVKLTPAGETVLEAGRNLAQDMYRLRDECRDLAVQGSDVLSVSALHSIALCVYPDFAKALQSHVGSFTTRMHASDYYDCLESLSLGRCELAMCYDHVLGPPILKTSQFQSRTIMKDPLVLVSTPQDEDEFEAALTSNSGNAALPLVSYSSGCFLGKMQEILTKSYLGHGVVFYPVFENSMSEAIRRMILNGAGMGWLPRSVAAQDISRGNLVELKGRSMVLELDVVLLRKPSTQSELVEMIWQQSGKVPPL